MLVEARDADRTGSNGALLQRRMLSNAITSLSLDRSLAWVVANLGVGLLFEAHQEPKSTQGIAKRGAVLVEARTLAAQGQMVLC